ncbi:UNVERIFIED_CONTAM: hypothetical protein NCL1_16242 [Trichonephila clavipes]
MVCGKKTMINATTPLQNFLTVQTSRKCLVREEEMSNPDHKVMLHWAEEARPPFRKSKSIRFTNDIQPLKYNLLPPQAYKAREVWTAGKTLGLYILQFYIFVHFLFLGKNV